jgi:stage IV sporulation protein FB
MRIGSLLGIRIRLNWLFLALLFTLSMVGLLPQAIIVFSVVLIHELAHAIVAKTSGLSVDEVELLPFGGVARIDDVLEVDPRIEMRVAIAGPLANLFLIGVGLVFRTYDQLSHEWVMFFINTNVTLVAFNVLPALPLDGGRVYRARLCGKLGFRRATQRAAQLGRIFAIIFTIGGSIGLFFGYVNLTLIVLGFFVYAAAVKEQKTAMYVLMRYLVRKQGELLRYGCLPSEHLVAVGATTVGEVVKLFVPQRYHLIWVLRDTGEVAGLLTEYDVVHALVELGNATPVEQVLGKK